MPLVSVLILPASATVVIDYVTIGDVGNAVDPLSGFGAVDHYYQIGKYEVTNAQYAEFLNAKGGSNASDIYHPQMAGYGITQSGTSGSFSYTVTEAFVNRPVVYVSWFDAARFANWLGNGQEDSDMETGAYTLNGRVKGIVLANVGATVYLPSEDEWYKAAYYNGGSGTYSIFPNGKSTITRAEANYLNFSGIDDVGTYSDTNFYGTFDQAGNAMEWNDAVFSNSVRRQLQLPPDDN